MLKNLKQQSIRLLHPVLLFSLLTLGYTNLYGDNINAYQAHLIARKYIDIESAHNQSTRAKQKLTAELSPYYIYNDSHGRGFVIVSGNDEMGEILAYSKQGQLDTTNISQETRYLLNSYREVYDELNANAKLSTKASTTYSISNKETETSEAMNNQPAFVLPLLRSHWNQDSPYSKFTTYVTGCVATAMSQLMYYHRWPLVGKGRNTYTVSYDGKERSADFSKSQYDWDNMDPDYLYGTYTEQQANAVAKLMSDVGIAVNMQYAPSGSGAYNNQAAYAFQNNFDYDVAMVTREDEGHAQFLEIIKDELRRGFPLYVAGNPSRGGQGHAWVIDGFDRDGMVHMNFGWGGQADAYYSLSALSLTTSGKEFNGRPLTFNKQLLVLLVHPNKSGTEKIKDEWRSEAPNIAFNIEGEMHFVDETPTSLEKEVKIAYNHFTNQSSSPFAGDIGMGIYDDMNQLVKKFPSTNHEEGGYTKVRFKFTEGKMPSGGLIDEDVVFSMDFSGLSDGIYTLAPIVCAKRDDDSWGSWMKMKKAPRFVMEVKEGKISYHEMSTKEANFQLASPPLFNKLPEIGQNIQVKLNLRKLNALPFDGKVRIELLNNQSEVVLTGETKGVVDFEGFANTIVNVPLYIPSDFLPGEYALRITVVKNYTNEERIVRNINQGEASKIEIQKGEETKEIFEKAIGLVTNNSGDGITSREIDVKREAMFRIGCVVYLRDGASYKGKVKLYLIDTVDGRQIPLTTLPEQLDLNSKFSSVTIFSGWLRKDNIKILNHRLYRLTLIGEIDGKMQDLWPKNTNPFEISIINGPYDQYPNNPSTDMKQINLNDQLIWRDNGLEINISNLQHVDVYNILGQKVMNLDLQGVSKTLLPLSKRLYILKIKTKQGVITRKVK